MTPEELKALFERTGALLAGHFQLSSGLHAEQYFQCALVLSDTEASGRLGRALASLAADWKAQTAAAPALGGVVIGHETARALKARSIFAERQNGRMTLRRGFAVRPGERVLIVEDVITTGKSTGEVIELLRGQKAEVVGAVCLVLRAPAVPELGVPLRALAHWPAIARDPKECPACAKGLPAVKPGSRPG